MYRNADIAAAAALLLALVKSLLLQKLASDFPGRRMKINVRIRNDYTNKTLNFLSNRA